MGGKHRLNAICEICDESFVRRRDGSGAIQRTCSRECGVELRRRLGHHPYGVPRGGTCRVPWRGCRCCGLPFLPKGSRHRRCEACRMPVVIPVERRCETCGEPLHGRQRRYCSRKHEARRQQERRCRKRQQAKRGKAFSLAAIVRRDNGICHLCGRAVEHDGDPNGDWAPSIDHLVTNVEGGVDEPDNVALAHRWCNSVRHTRTVAEARQLLAA